MIVLHHLNNSRSQRVLWLLEELGVEYEVKRYQRDAETMLAPPELKQVHPLGKSPVITDGAVTVAETGAIIEYLVDTYGGGKLKPAADTPDALAYRYWLHYAEGSAMPPLLLKLVFSRVAKAPVPFFIKPVVKGIVAKVSSGFIDPQIKLHLSFQEQTLQQSQWFAGDEFSAADIQMSFPLEGAAARGGLGAYPRLQEFLDRIHARPAYQKALEVGGPYQLMS